MSDSLPPYGLYSPRNSPGQNAGVVAFPFSRASSQPRDWTEVSPIAGGFFLPAEPQGKPKNTGVGSLPLLQGIFPTQRLNSGLPHYRWIFYQLSHKGSPWIMEWVFDPFSSRSSQCRNWTRFSCIAGRLFTNWAKKEAPKISLACNKKVLLFGIQTRAFSMSPKFHEISIPVSEITFLTYLIK